MKKITLIFSLLVAMFTTAMAQETVDLTTGTYGGQPGDLSRYPQWTSTNGVTIVSTDGNSDTEIATMKYHNGFRLDITSDVSNKELVGTKYTITAPEGYVVTKMTIKNGGKDYETYVDCGLKTVELPKSNPEYKNEVEIEFPEGENFFYLRGPVVGRYIYITSLTITKVGGDNNQGGEGEGEVEGGDNNQGGEGEGGDNNQGGEGEGGDNNQGGEGNEGEVEGGDNNEGGEGEGGDNNEGEGEVEGGDNDETSINEVKVENAQVIYDLTGRRVNEITKAGIYIINGKKVIK